MLDRMPISVEKLGKDGASNIGLTSAVNIIFQPSVFRSSVELKNALKAIVERYVVPQLKYCWGQQSFNIRLGALMKLAVSFLCMPRFSTLLGFGLLSTQDDSYDVAKRSDDNLGKGYESNTRLNAYVIELLSVLIEVERLMIDKASDNHLDERRIDLLVELVLLRRSPFIPFVITMTENCPEALKYMSCHVLVVSALADDILESINTVTKKIRSLLSLDLSPTTNSTRGILKSEFSKYFVWMRKEQEGLTKICRNNEIICCMNKAVKAWLKGEEYESAAQIVDCYRQKYKSFLTSMNVPMQSFRSEDIKQALKDVNRDRITLNGDLHLICRRRDESDSDDDDNSRISRDDTYSDVSSTSNNEYEDKCNPEVEVKVALIHTIIKELCSSLSKLCNKSINFSLGIRNDNSFVFSDNDKSNIPNELSSLEFEKNDANEAFCDSSFCGLAGVDDISSSGSFEKLSISELDSNKEKRGMSVISLDDTFDDCYSHDTNYSVNRNTNNVRNVSSVVSKDDVYTGNSSADCVNSPITDIINGNPTTFTSLKGEEKTTILQKKLLEMLFSHTLLAASRTTAGGDAFLILENLYGGEGLIFSPRTYRNMEKNSKNHTSTQEENFSGIKIAISLNGINVVMKEQYNLFVKESIEQNMELSLPLISFECTTETNILLPPNLKNSEEIYYNKLLYNVEKVCRRYVTIEPFISIDI